MVVIVETGRAPLEARATSRAPSRTASFYGEREPRAAIPTVPLEYPAHERSLTSRLMAGRAAFLDARMAYGNSCTPSWPIKVSSSPHPARWACYRRSRAGHRGPARAGSCPSIAPASSSNPAEPLPERISSSRDSFLRNRAQARTAGLCDSSMSHGEPMGPLCHVHSWSHRVTERHAHAADSAAVRLLPLRRSHSRRLSRRKC